jgi:hypothetical protein
MKAALIAGMVAFLAWAIFYFGIYWGDYGFWKHRGHQEFRESGISQVQPAMEMNQLFEDCRHYLISAVEPADAAWNSTAFFGGRYELTMQVPVKIESSGTGSVTGKPTFVLKEVESVSVSPSSQVGASYSDTLRFSAAGWQKVFRSGGDFETIGYIIDPTEVPKFDRLVAASRGWR